MQGGAKVKKAGLQVCVCYRGEVVVGEAGRGRQSVWGGRGEYSVCEKKAMAGMGEVGRR